MASRPFRAGSSFRACGLVSSTLAHWLSAATPVTRTPHRRCSRSWTNGKCCSLRLTYGHRVEPLHVRKAFAYITRGEELLVFHHRDVSLEVAGIQVPAGTIRDGEAAADAALREAIEETGLDEVSLVGYLGSADYDVRPGRNEIHERHFFHLRAPAECPDTWDWDEPHDGNELPTTFCFWWTPMRNAHALAAGMGALVAW